MYSEVGIPALPLAYLLIDFSIGLYKDSSGSVKSSKYEWQFDNTIPVSICVTLTWNGFSSTRKVSAKISCAFFEAAYVADKR